MDFKSEGNWVIDCPHELQRYVDCNDDTAKELAGLVYEYATDFALRDSIRRGKPQLSTDDPFGRMVLLLTNYDVFPQPFFEGIVFHRYERPPIGAEAREMDALVKYLREGKSDSVHVPCNICDIIRAFGEFGGKEVAPDIIANCLGFYDDPACTCPVCGKSWKRTWDE